MKLLGDLLEYAIRVNGDAKTLFQGEREVSYVEGSQKARALAASLLQMGLKPGEHIGILATNCIEYWESYYAVHYSGMVLAPLNIRLTPSELEFILQDGRIRALIITQEFVPLVQNLAQNCPELQHLILIGEDRISGFLGYPELVDVPPVEKPERDWREDDLVNLCYTGGTTGLPKGVMLSQRNVVCNARHVAETHRLAASDTWLHIAPPDSLDVFSVNAQSVNVRTHSWLWIPPPPSKSA